MTSRKTYTYDEAYAASLEYFKGDELAARVWTSKYALKDSYGHLFEATPDDMHHRIANEIARIESKYPNAMSAGEVYSLLEGFRYIVPQGSPMAGIGNDYQVGSLSNCFVIGLEGKPDSYGGIIKIDEEQVQLMKRRGGVGHDLSHIRPKGTPVKNPALTSTGLVPFMERYSNSTREVAQDGRRGALMLTVSIKHPDSEQFIDAKMTPGKVTGANVSVKIDDDFMTAAVSGQPYRQQFPIDSAEPSVVKEIDAAALWSKIVHNAWKSAEPGVLFWDTITRQSVADCYADQGFQTVSTNPCGEIPLCPYDSCRLVAINLYSYVKNPFTPQAEFDFALLAEHAGKAQRIMDDIIDLEMEKIDIIIEKIKADPETQEVKQTELNLWEKIRNKTLKGRRTGCGTTGEGDMLAALGLRYGTKEATDFSTEVHKRLALAYYSASVDMAPERGAFEIYDAEKEKDNPYIMRLRDADPLAVSLGEVAYHAVVDLGDAHHLAYRGDVLLPVRLARLRALQVIHKVEVVLHRHVEVERRLLGKITYLLLRLKGILEHVDTAYRGGAARRREVPGDYVHGCGFACAVRPEEADYLALVYLEGDVGHAPLVAVKLCQAVDFDHLQNRPFGCRARRPHRCENGRGAHFWL